MDSEEKREAKVDAYTRPGISMDEAIEIAVDQGMSEVYANRGTEGRESFQGIGPGVPTGNFKGTAAEFREFMRKRREELKHGLRDRKRSA